MIKALIFDMDGVLIDSMKLHARAWKTAFGEAGIEFDEREIFLLEGENDTGIIKNVMNIGNVDPAEFCRLMEIVPPRKHELFEIDRALIFQGMDSCLEKIRKKFMTAVVSGSDRTTVEKITGKYFPGMFDVMVSGDDTVRGKPAPDPYQKALELLGIDKEDCIVIENAILGVMSAKNADIFTIGVPTYIDRKQLQHADIILEDHRQLFNFLELLCRF